MEDHRRVTALGMAAIEPAWSTRAPLVFCQSVLNSKGATVPGKVVEDIRNWETSHVCIMKAEVQFQPYHTYLATLGSRYKFRKAWDLKPKPQGMVSSLEVS